MGGVTADLLADLEARGLLQDSTDRDSLRARLAEGPITLQALDGSITFTVAGQRYDVGPGQLLSAGAGIRHAVSSEVGATLLLTVALPNRPLASGPAM